MSVAYYHARNYCRQQSRMQIEKLGEKERGYLVGMVVGDGCLVRHKARGEYLAQIALDKHRDLDVFQFVRSTFENAGKKVNVRIERGMFILRIWSKPFYDFFLKHVRLERGVSSHYTKLLLDTERWSRDFTIGFIGGLIDSDGHIEGNRSTGHYGATITTSSLSLIGQFHDLCAAQRIKISRRVSHHAAINERARYVVHIWSKSLNSVCSELLCVKHQRLHGGPGRN